MTHRQSTHQHGREEPLAMPQHADTPAGRHRLPSPPRAWKLPSLLTVGALIGSLFFAGGIAYATDVDTSEAPTDSVSTLVAPSPEVTEVVATETVASVEAVTTAASETEAARSAEFNLTPSVATGDFVAINGSVVVANTEPGTQAAIQLDTIITGPGTSLSWPTFLGYLAEDGSGTYSVSTVSPQALAPGEYTVTGEVGFGRGIDGPGYTLITSAPVTITIPNPVVTIPVPEPTFYATGCELHEDGTLSSPVEYATIQGVQVPSGSTRSFEGFDVTVYSAGTNGGLIRSFADFLPHDGYAFPDGVYWTVFASSNNTECVNPTDPVTPTDATVSQVDGAYYTAVPQPIAVTGGESVSIGADPGFWTTGPTGDWSDTSITAALRQNQSYGAVSISLPATASVDGSVLTLSIPAYLPNTLIDSDVPLAIRVDLTGAAGGSLYLSVPATLLGTPEPAVSFSQDDSDPTQVTVTIVNAGATEQEFGIGIHAERDGGSLTVPAGETGQISVAAEVGDTITVGFPVAWAAYTVQPSPTPTPTPEPTPTPTPEPTVESSVSLSVTSALAGASVTVTASGFEPGEPIEIWLHSTPTRLFQGTADADGNVHQTVTIPAGTEPGDHRIELRGETSGSVFVPLTVTATPLTTTGDDAVALASTGGTASTAFWMAGTAVLLTLAGALITAQQRRKQRVQQ